jgi:exopolysaccharide production protein ExoY
MSIRTNEAESERQQPTRSAAWVMSRSFEALDSDVPVGRRLAIEHRLARLRPQLVVKRAFDVVGSLVLLTLSAPVQLVAGAFVRLTSDGPALFRQERHGKGGQLFAVLKLRTMVPLPEGVDVSSVHDAENGRLIKSSADPRITKVGRILRRTSLDELPQLVNVLNGQMSLVGPRPLLPFMLEPYPELTSARGLVRPGLTGLWQVSVRTGSDSALSMAEPDLAYLENYSLWLDLRILVRTIPACIGGAGAV